MDGHCIRGESMQFLDQPQLSNCTKSGKPPGRMQGVCVRLTASKPERLRTQPSALPKEAPRGDERPRRQVARPGCEPYGMAFVS